MGSLQEALAKSGLVDEKELERRKTRQESGPKSGKKSGKKSGNKAGPGRRGKSEQGKSARGKPARGKSTNSKTGSKSDLARAYAARRKAEQAAEEREKQARLADQEARRQRNLKLDAIVEGRALNREDGEIPRYFEHIGRVRRVLCTPQQREAINAGRLGVVSLRGRYLIVEPEVQERYREIAPDLVPDLTGTEPEADADGPPVPDDLVW